MDHQEEFSLANIIEKEVTLSNSARFYILSYVITEQLQAIPYVITEFCCFFYVISSVFGCLCFSKIMNNRDKFSARSIPSIFLGYSHTQKGYKLLNIPTGSVCISRDVLVPETEFPFLKIETNLQSIFNITSFIDVSEPCQLINSDFVSPINDLLIIEKVLLFQILII